MRVPLSWPRYEDLGQKHAYVNELLQRLESAPGVEGSPRWSSAVQSS
jgi:hypothetical protein